jgi:hypothetical protein
MFKLISIMTLILLSTFIFAEEVKEETPEVCIRLIATDGVNSILCIDGFAWLMVIHTGGAAVSQMREIKDGKEVLKTCRCDKGI